MTVTDNSRTAARTESDTESVMVPMSLAELLNPGADDSWRDHAACRGIEGDVFYPEKGATATAARVICGRCPVRAHCLAEALRLNERHGMWGGLSAHERRPLRRHVPATRTPDRQVQHHSDSHGRGWVA